jgi:hypothetical protein
MHQDSMHQGSTSSDSLKKSQMKKDHGHSNGYGSLAPSVPRLSAVLM